jgi:outer membrane protein assembly factor BamE (lipoprotein component of BamABCDE complex)
MSKITSPIAVIICVVFLLAAGCRSSGIRTADTERAVTVSPDLDYSNTVPDCETAGKRIAESIKVGMPVSEVLRLVGKPAYRFPGSWWWSNTFDKEGWPYIQYDALFGTKDGKITRVSSDTTNC